MPPSGPEAGDPYEQRTAAWEAIMLRPALIVHGGAGAIEAGLEPIHRDGCQTATRIGWQVLEGGGSAVEAAVAAVLALEDAPLFNAGLGSVLTSAGTVETDASVMEGATLAAGACGAVSGVRNPILLARAIMRDPLNLLLVGAGAEAFAREHGVPLCAAEDLITTQQRTRWQQRAGTAPSGGTVGAVAVDAAGHLAAATSTGGLFYKRPGRVGDSAVVGAGTYADDRLGGASATGVGEAIIRVSLAKTAVDLLRDGLDPMAAATAAIALLAGRTGAAAGLVLIDVLGRIGYARNSPRMPIAYRDALRGSVASAC
jgi:L-asparaginase / beta-aspartyl-peptidase